MNKALYYSNIGLISRRVSTLESRNDADTSIIFAGEKLTIPLIASCMPDVCDGNMAKELHDLGSYGFIHRFNTIEEQVEEYKKSGGHCGCAIGINGDYFERFCSLLNVGCRSFVVDVANGANTKMINVLEKLKSRFSPLYLTVGNVATIQCYEWLARIGVYAIRCGIAGGSVCTTRTETGLFYPMASSIKEIAECRDKYPTLIIADGSIKEPQDLCKSLVLGADLAMAGSIFASTEESPAKVVKIDGQLFKLFKGSASFSTQKSVNKIPEYVEGMEVMLRYSGPLKKVINRFRNGLRSSMSYMNAKTLDEYRRNADWCEI